MTIINKSRQNLVEDVRERGPFNIIEQKNISTINQK